MRLSDRVSNAVAPTTLPPVISRESSYGPNLDGQEIFESGVAAALEEFETVDGSLQKVVLARRMDLRFDPSAELNGLDMLRKWKFGGHEGGHLFYLNPGVNDAEVQREFVGCTPERLFQIQNGEVISEALAGTRPRGSTQEADEQLSRDLFQSPKDREENLITGRLIRSSFQELYSRNWVKTRQRLSGNVGELFVRRLRHLQHICQRFRGTLRDDCNPVDVSQYLLESLHPTPAVGGYPGGEALRFIRDKESFAFDRGYYAGPFGCFGNDSADIVVAIRSSLITRATSSFRYRSPTSIGVYAGAGIVPGSTLQNEWAEISYKLGVVTSLFPQSPFTLQSASTPNIAWANSFIEELIRCGVTQFYVCPGSRSTPLVAALAKALRANVGFLHALSVHDERGAGFRALGYGRGSSRPAAVITSSGTAISNLYPAIMEAGMDGVPMMILTADRPYENRATGANQAVDQVKAFSSTYIRWFRDIPPPSDDVPVSLALSDAGHAVHLSRQLRGPVHLNIQFRENLAPESGPIRNDNRVDSMTAFNGFRFTDVPGFHRWAAGGGRWTKSFSGVSYDIIGSNRNANVFGEAIEEIAQLIRSSRRGIIIVGNLRTSTNEVQAEEDLHLTDVISYFAQAVGFPIVAGVQSGSLRFRSPAVIPYVEHVMKSPAVSQNMNPDFVLQIGSPLVSTEVVNMITSSMKERTQVDNSPLGPLYHVLLHPHHPTERSDPSFTISHRVSSDISPFLKGLLTQLEVLGGGDTECSSDLAPLVLLGRKLGEQIPEIIHDASRKVSAKFDDESEDVPQLTEPQVALAMAQVISNRDLPMSLFLSNSMPVRDAEFFLYPTLNRTTDSHRHDGLFNVGVNRGASGIDGIISSASGFAEACDKPTTLLIGDLAALHDINALHTLVSSRRTQYTSGKRSPPLTTVVVNNDGGGIFSFLPIAKHGSDVNFDEFFGTPTNTFSFEKGAAAFGLKFHQSASFESFVSVYERALSFDAPSVIEAVVTGRDANVAVHQEITRQAANFVSDVLGNGGTESTASLNRLPVKRYSAGREDSPSVGSGENKTLLLLHGWMGDKSEWDHVGDSLAQALPPQWTVLSVDLPGHGDSELRLSSDLQAIRSALGLTKPADEIETEFAMDDIAGAVLRSLSNEHGVPSLDAIAGYSLGGRVALAMQRLCETSSDDLAPHKLVTDDTKMIILSSNPGTLLSELDITRELDAMRIAKDDSLSRTMLNACNRAFLGSNALSEESLLWSRFLENWYNAPLWGGLQARDFEEYEAMLARRTSSLSTRGQDLAAVLRQCSPGRQLGIDWKFVNAANTLYVAGALDKKYSSLGRQWSTTVEDMKYVELPDVGHALLTESPLDVAGILTDFILDEKHTPTTTGVKTEVDTTASTPAEVISRQLQEQLAKDEMYTSAKDYCDAEDQERCTGLIGGLEYEFFTISLENERRKEKGIVGVGWGDKAKASESNRMTERTGLILNIFSSDGSAVGVGEVSPLAGLHPETLKEAESQVTEIKSRLQDVEADLIPDIHAEQFLALDGALGHYLDRLLKVLDIKEVGPSVRSGLEMALVSLASQNVKMPILQALTEYSTGTASASKRPSTSTLLPLSGLIMRGRDISMFPSRSPDGDIVYPSLKVKVGHQTANEDALSMSSALQETERGGKIRADANRAWDEGSAIHFAAALEGIDVDVIERLEFIEEPLQKVAGVWSLEHQVEALERWHKHSGIPYALDESLADLADSTGRDFEAMRDVVRKAFSEGAGGCAAFVLKPALLGLELSMRLARMAHNELGIGAVFSSSFDSGVGLAYTSFLAAAADASVPSSDKALYSHGVGTFSMLAGDTLSPSFASYVTDQGRLQVASLSRAFFGLGLDDMRDSFVTERPEVAPVAIESEPQAPDYRASAATSSSGREISVVVSLPLPFSDDIACSRFSDLPQQSRWSPWLSSVAYLDAGRETEWTLNVRGVRFSWRAVSSILEKPYKGIMWESVSGLKNMGVVEFVPTTPDSCTMKVRMTIITPRVVTTLFPGASVFAEDFLQNKLLKWSLEMFRDVVKGDLALERGDVELGDALFGAVEGRANAIEATLSNPLPEESPPGDVDN
jgi:2-succinyl-5-enolpyruvyl-6-hydroxy-3-cyclohexene-1-carboxylate synthase/o-succinylbenzoate synthase